MAVVGAFDSYPNRVKCNPNTRNEVDDMALNHHRNLLLYLYLLSSNHRYHTRHQAKALYTADWPDLAPSRHHSQGRRILRTH